MTSQRKRPLEELEEESDLQVEEPAIADFKISDINIKTEQQSGHFLIDMLKHEEINMNTPFQRSSDLWKPETMSRFIESMMLKFPIPPFYFDISYRMDGKQERPFWQVVDGLQRLSALRRFFVGDGDGRKLKLRSLDFFKEMEGKTAETLPRSLIRNIESCQIGLFLIYPNTPKAVKHRIFERVNTGGLRLTDQEIRHALNQGKPTELLKNAVESGLVANGINIDPGRMKDQELALRFFSFEVLPPTAYEGSMKIFLDKAMEALNDLPKSRERELLDRFAKSVALVTKVLGPMAFRKQLGRAINRALFDSYTYSAARLEEDAADALLADTAGARKRYAKSLVENKTNKKYLDSISTATAREENIRLRFKVARSVLNVT